MIGRARIGGVLLALVSLAACRRRASSDDPAPAPAATDDDVVIVVPATGGSLGELERTLAIPLEAAVAGLRPADTIDTVITRQGLELRLTVAPGEDARGLVADVRARLSQLPAGALAGATPRVYREPKSALDVLLEGGEEPARPFEHPSAHLLHTCDRIAVRDVTIDPARLTATGVTLDEVLRAITAQRTSLATLTVTPEITLAQVAELEEGDLSTCRVVSGESRLARLQVARADVAPAIRAALTAGWKLAVLRHEAQAIIELPDRDPEEALRTAARKLGSQPGIDRVIALLEREPHLRGRLLFGTSYDAKVREVLAALPEVRLGEAIAGDFRSARVEAILVGDDRAAMIARARAALAEATPLPAGTFVGCEGCDEETSVELALAEDPDAPGAQRAEGALGVSAGMLSDALGSRGLVLPAREATPIRIRIASPGPEANLAALGALPLRSSNRKIIPLSTIATARAVPRPTMLLRHAGKPAVIVWRQPWSETGGDAEHALTAALPGATVRARELRGW